MSLVGVYFTIQASRDRRASTENIGPRILPRDAVFDGVHGDQKMCRDPTALQQAYLIDSAACETRKVDLGESPDSHQSSQLAMD
jgi:hypothetical protein